MRRETNNLLLKALMLAGAAPFCGVPAALAQDAPPPPPATESAVPAGTAEPAAARDDVIRYSYVGVALETLPAATYRENSQPGVQAVYVVKNSPADLAGLRSGDILVSLDGQKLFFPNQFSALVRSYAPGSEVEVVLLRGGEKIRKIVKIGERRIAAPKRPERPVGRPARDDVRLYINGREISFDDKSELDGWISLTPNGILIRDGASIPEEFRRLVSRIHAKLPNSRQMLTSLRKQYEDARLAAVGKARQTFSQVFFGQGNTVIIVGDDSGRKVTVSRAGDSEALFSGNCTTQEEIDAIPEEAKKIIDSFTVLKPMPVAEKAPAAEEEGEEALPPPPPPIPPAAVPAPPPPPLVH